MSPKDKARDLFASYLKCIASFQTIKPLAISKQCALIGVKETVAALKKIFGDNAGIVLSDIVHWEDVAEEIKKL